MVKKENHFTYGRPQDILTGQPEMDDEDAFLYGDEAQAEQVQQPPQQAAAPIAPLPSEEPSVEVGAIHDEEQRVEAVKDAAAAVASVPKPAEAEEGETEEEEDEDSDSDLEIIMDASAEPPPRQPGYGRPGMPRGPNQTPTRPPPTQSALTSEYTPLSRDGLGRSPAQFLSPQKTGLSPAPTPTARAAPPNQHPGLLRQESSEAGEVRASPRPGALVSSDDVPEGPPPPVPSTAPRLDLSPGAEALQLPAGSGKSIYDVDIESLDEKPWRKPGADLTDYFNYGFNEESWRAYARKKSSVVEQRIEAEKEDEEHLDNGAAEGQFSGDAMLPPDMHSIMQMPGGMPQQMQAMQAMLGQGNGMMGMPGMQGMQGMPGMSNEQMMAFMGMGGQQGGMPGMPGMGMFGAPGGPGGMFGFPGGMQQQQQQLQQGMRGRQSQQGPSGIPLPQGPASNSRPMLGLPQRFPGQQAPLPGVPTGPSADKAATPTNKPTPSPAVKQEKSEEPMGGANQGEGKVGEQATEGDSGGKKATNGADGGAEGSAGGEGDIKNDAGGIDGTPTSEMNAFFGVPGMDMSPVAAAGFPMGMTGGIPGLPGGPAATVGRGTAPPLRGANAMGAGVRGTGWAGRGRGAGVRGAPTGPAAGRIPSGPASDRVASSLPSNVPTGPRNPGKRYNDRDTGGGGADALDYGGGGGGSDSPLSARDGEREEGTVSREGSAKESSRDERRRGERPPRERRESQERERSSEKRERTRSERGDKDESSSSRRRRGGRSEKEKRERTGDEGDSSSRHRSGRDREGDEEADDDERGSSRRGERGASPGDDTESVGSRRASGGERRRSGRDRDRSRDREHRSDRERRSTRDRHHEHGVERSSRKRSAPPDDDEVSSAAGSTSGRKRR